MGPQLSARELVKRIDARWEEEQSSGHREHLGASEVGEACTRKIWYNFHWYPRKKWQGRMLRLVDRGRREETFIRKLLAAEGFVFLDTDDKQITFSALDGHFGGSCDGVMKPPSWWHHQETMILEMKTSNDKNYKKLDTDTLRLAKPEHHVQMQTYMNKFGINYGLYVAVNKNDDSLYLEEVTRDRVLMNDIERKASFVILNTTAPQRISENPSFWKCKMCDSQPYCFKPETLTGPNCRNCANSKPAEQKTWFCNYHEDTIPKETIPVGCVDHQWRE